VTARGFVAARDGSASVASSFASMFINNISINPVAALPVRLARES
jgi:hypothetical protein